MNIESGGTSSSSAALDMAMFHQAFFEEAADLLSDLEGLLLQLEETPEEPELLNTIFRCAHSIKGGSATFGFTDIAHFTHGLETLLDQVRNGQVPVDAVLIQLLLESLDQMRALLAVARDEQSAAPDSEPLIARIAALSSGQARPPSPLSAPEKAVTAAVSQDGIADVDGRWGVWDDPNLRQFSLRFVPSADILRQGGNPLLLLDQLASAADIFDVVCDTSRLPDLEEIDPETSYLGWTIRMRTDQTREQLLEIFEFFSDDGEIELTEIPRPTMSAAVPVASSVAPTAAPPAATATATATAATATASSASSDTHTLRVGTDKVDKLINLVGEMVINQTMLNAIVQNFTMDRIGQLTETAAAMERASRELQERVMAVRMLPIKHAFGRFPRLVRDLAAACGKKIDLRMSGEETELDKTVIEAIADPLTHLVRNSIDHGLETPDERRAAGKTETGTVLLHAFHEGGSIVVEISDDGRGLNRERIMEKAIERGWVNANDPPLADDTIHSFIFQPGFSTAPAVTDLSGRGVGMDIVRQAIQGLGGTITLTSTPGQGTRFRIRLPLTMAILEGLSVGVGDEVYILPLTSIVESVQPKVGDVRMIAGRTEVVLVRGDVLPIVRLYRRFGATPRVTDPTRGLLVIVENDKHKVALLVDELIGQSQVVIKSLETNYRKVDSIAGATILGDGRVALILDVPGLIRGTQPSGPLLAAAA